MSVFYDTASNFHPYECDGPGKCIHCDRRKVVFDTQGTRQVEHDPATCALCDPEYDGRPNDAWGQS